MSLDLLLRGGTAVTPAGILTVDIGVRDGRIEWIGSGATGAPGAAETVDLSGLHVLPGVIDTQVHFREPGGTHKEDLETGTRGAAKGGVTGIFEMPNTNPPTISASALTDKLSAADGRAWCDYAFFIGARSDNLEQLGELELLPGCSGVKLFMGKSTGDLLIDTEEDLRRTLKHIRRRCSVHAEDESRLNERASIAKESGDVKDHPVWRDELTATLATERLLRVARECGKTVHVLHITTADELPILQANRDVATVEMTPQHLTFSAPDCYERLGTRAQMNPPVRSEEHRLALWGAVQSGLLDVIGSDHAPHTLEEKARPYPSSPSGMTGVQTLVPVMLDHVHQGNLSLERFVDLTSAGPARVFGIVRKGRISPGYDADFTIVDLKKSREVQDSWIESRSGWTPYHGMTLTGWPTATMIRGRFVMRDDELLGEPAGQPVSFYSALPQNEKAAH